MYTIDGYRNRVADQLLQDQLEAAGVVLVQGAKIHPFFMTVLLAVQTLRKSIIFTHKTTKNRQESSPELLCQLLNDVVRI